MKAGSLEIEILANIAKLEADMRSMKRAVGDGINAVTASLGGGERALKSFGSRFGEFAKLAETSADRAGRAFRDSFDEIEQLANKSIRLPARDDGGINLGAAQARAAAEAAREQAQAIGLVEAAAQRAAAGTGEMTQETRMYLAAASAARIEAERHASGLDREATAVARLEDELNQLPAALAKVAESARQEAAAIAQGNAELIERARLLAAVDRTNGADRSRATDSGATYSALAARALEEEAQALREASFAYGQFELAARKGMAALRDQAEAARQTEALAAAGVRLRASIDPAFAAQERFNDEMREARTLIGANAISLDDYCAKLRVEQSALDASTAAHRRGAAGSAAARQAMQGASYQVQDFITQVSMGTNPINAFAVQGAQLAGQFSAVEGKAGDVARFFMGPWGLAITAGLLIMGPFVAKLFEQNKALDDALDKLKKDAAETEVTARAKAAFAHTQAAVAAAIREGTEATTRSIAASQSAAEQANIAAKNNLAEELSIRGKTQARLADAKAAVDAQIEAARATGERGDVAGQGILKLIRQASALQAELDKQTSLVVEAQARVQQTRIDLATEAAKRLVDPVARLNKLYDDQVVAAQRRARAEGTVTSALTQQLTTIERSRQAALKAEQERTSAARRADNDNRQTGRTIDLSEAQTIVRSIGGIITSTTRSFEQQRVLYEKYLAGRGPLAAKPGTSDHEVGNALDIAKTPGMSLAKIREAFRDAGVSIKQLLDEGRHFHVAWKKGADDAAAASRKLAEVQTSLAKNFDPATAAAIAYRDALKQIAGAKLDPATAAAYGEAARAAFVKARAAAFTLPSIDVIAEQAAADEAMAKSKATFEANVLKPLRDQIKLYGLVGTARDEAALSLEKEAFLASNMDQGIETALARWQEYYDAKRDLIGRDAEAEAAAAEASRLTEHLDGIVDAANDAADALSRAFGRTGSAIGDVTVLLAVYAKRQKEIDDLRRTEKLSGVDAAARSTQLQLSTTVGLIGATKTLFREKSAGYRTMEAAEKALAIVQLARTAIDVAGGAARIFASLGPWGFPVVGAMLATMAALGFSGGGSVSGPSMPTAKDVQDAQGTGTVLGDSGAKSGSISNALDLLAKNSNRDLEYSSEAVKSLRAIESGIGNLAAAVARETKVGGGLDASALGLGTNTSGGLLGLGGLFSKKVTKELNDSGLQFDGTSVASAIAGNISANLYQEILTTTKKSGFLGIGGSTKTTTSTVTSAADAGLTTEVSLLVANMRNAIVSAAGTIGIDGAAAMLDAFQIDIGRISFKDLTSEEIESELAAVFSRVGDDMAGAVGGAVAEYQRAGEGMLETLTRLAKEYQTVDVTLRSIGMTFGSVGLASVGARTALVELFGGLDEFTEATGFFRENFLSEAEQMAPVIAAVRAEMARLGQAGVDTKDEFKALVLGLDLSSASGQEMYAALMAVAPAFLKSTDYLASLNGELKETAKTAEQLAAIEKQRRSLEIQLMEATGDTAGALAAKRADEVAGLDESLRAIQLQIYAATDAAQAARDLAAANEAAARATDEATRAAEQLATQRRGLEIELMEATGNAAGALTARRADEIAALDASLRPIKEAILAAQDATAAQEALAAAQAEAAQTASALAQTRRGMEIELMEALGDASGALAARRADELAGTDASLRALREQIFAAQDAAAANAVLAQAQQDAASAAASAAAQVAAAVAQIASQRSSLEIQLMRAQGNEAGAVSAERDLQLAATDESLRGLQQQVWAAEDARKAAEEAARAQVEYAQQMQQAAQAAQQAAQDAEQLRRQRAGLDAQLLDLLGNSAGALALRRQEELAALDASLRPLQQSIYAQEDLAAAASAAADRVNDARGVLTDAYKRESDALQQTIDTMGGLGESLRKYRAELAGGDAAGGNAYLAALGQLNVTDAKAARGDAGALAALEAAGKDFLTVSRDQAGSLLDYQRDVARVAAAVDRGISATDEAVDYAQAQLDALKNSVAGLIDVNESVISVRDAITALQVAIAGNPVPTVPTVPAAPVTATSGSGQPVQVNTAELERRIDSLSARLEVQNTAVAENTGRMARFMARWDDDGLPTRDVEAGA